MTAITIMIALILDLLLVPALLKVTGQSKKVLRQQTQTA
ncbi:hypothetical protein P781_19130 [Vibrio mimicus CAIM 1883]|nr:hypothetical protein P781_19130 [Vibrio mimicus CAIM 1883]